MCAVGLQASVLEMLADLLASPAGSAMPREADEDLLAMRAEAGRKLEELVEVRRPGTPVHGAVTRKAE